jgi:phage shock protein PspC (stress-responsive transcriptional regulator)
MTSASPRTLTRSTTDRKISGVSGGLGAYLGVDPVLIRVGFVVTSLASGIGLLAYLALLAIVPADEGHPAPVPAGA